MYAILIYADDKHKVPIGESTAISIGIRNKLTLAPLDKEISVYNHDFNKLSLTPSVSLFVNIPDNITESFYQGQVYVFYKDVVFQPSCNLRHVTELYINFKK